MTLRIASLAAVLLVASAALSQTPQGEPESLSPQALAERGLDDDAIAAWRHQIAQNASDRAPRIALIDFLLAKDRFNDALDEARAAIEAIPRDFDLLMRMTLACQRKGEALALTLGGRTSSKDWFVDVIRWAGEASAIAPSKHEPYAIRGMARFGLGRIDEAKEDAETLIRVAKDHPSGYLLLADCLFEEYQTAKKDGETERAKALAARIESAVDTALKLDAKRFLGWRRRGDVLAWEGKIDEATKAWSEALGLDPERGTPYDWIRDNVDAKLRIAMFTRALERFDALGTTPANAKARLHWELGRLLFDAEQYDACRKQFQACYDLRNDWLNALFYHGLASWELDDKDMSLLAFGLFAQKDAVLLAQAVRDSGPSRDVNKSYVKYFADLSFRRGNAPMSRDLNHTIALLEDDAARWNNYAFLCRETGLFEQSHDAYAKALDHAPDDPQLLNDAAVILQYHLHRDLDQAKAMYERAIANTKKQLDKKKLPKEDKERYELAQKNAAANLEALKAELRKKQDNSKK